MNFPLGTELKDHYARIFTNTRLRNLVGCVSDCTALLVQSEIIRINMCDIIAIYAYFRVYWVGSCTHKFLGSCLLVRGA